MNAFIEALTFQAGYNAALVMLGAGFLGMASGFCGTFLFLRKRALLADGIAHATLPGIALAFLVMVSLGADGRALPGLLLGAALSAGLGLLAINAMLRHTRLREDAAIGAVLSVFFGFGIVLLTVIQSFPAGKQAGLQGFLLGSTAGMLFTDAITIFLGGLASMATAFLLRRPFTLLAFDPIYAQTRGFSPARLDQAMMLLAAAITLTALKLVGLVLAVALLIIPPAAARFWSGNSMRMALVAGLIGGLAAIIGTALSVAIPKMPTGPIIVLIAFAAFVVSMLAAPHRGLWAARLRHLPPIPREERP